jgi:hypothetical protein
MEDLTREEILEQVIDLITNSEFYTNEEDEITEETNLLTEAFLSKEDCDRFLDVLDLHFEIEVSRSSLFKNPTVSRLCTLVSNKI